MCQLADLGGQIPPAIEDKIRVTQDALSSQDIPRTRGVVGDLQSAMLRIGQGVYSRDEAATRPGLEGLHSRRRI
jgi:hypothetical protein